jgi:hypothetical protein
MHSFERGSTGKYKYLIEDRTLSILTLLTLPISELIYIILYVKIDFFFTGSAQYLRYEDKIVHAAQVDNLHLFWK